jgi:hypothetical protein
MLLANNRRGWVAGKGVEVAGKGVESIHYITQKMA